MKLFVKDGQPNQVTITDKDFLAEGGEGKIYGKGNTIYKIYTDPKKMINEAKITELRALNRETIIAPRNVLLSDKQVPIGFTMDWAKDTTALCKLFTNDFRSRFNVTDDIILELMKSMVGDINYIHSQRCLIVDGNEMNYLVDMNSFKKAYFIDVDSWQTPSFPATAIMLSIRDFHSQKFSELTDWFSFAVICTQLFLGIHPYKGTHPSFKKSDMEGRMKANVSVFDPDVKLPSTTRPVANMPSAIREWLIQVLQHGKRLPPPTDMGNILAVTTRLYKNIVGTAFTLDLVEEYSSAIIKYNEVYVMLQNNECICRDSIHKFLPRSCELIKSPTGHSYFCYINGSDRLIFDSLNGRKPTIDTGIAGQEKMVYDNKLYVKNEDKLIEITVDEMGEKVIVGTSKVWNILPHATKMFNGCIYQDILGVPYFMIFYGAKSSCYQFKVEELKGYQVLEAKYDNGFMVVVAVKANVFSTFWFKVFGSLGTYKVFASEIDSDYHVPNFVTLPNGVVVILSTDDTVTICSNSDKSDARKDLKDPAVTFDMKLTRNGMQVMGRLDKKLYKISMK